MIILQRELIISGTSAFLPTPPAGAPAWDKKMETRAATFMTKET